MTLGNHICSHQCFSNKHYIGPQVRSHWASVMDDSKDDSALTIDDVQRGCSMTQPQSGNMQKSMQKSMRSWILQFTFYPSSIHRILPIHIVSGWLNLLEPIRFSMEGWEPRSDDWGEWCQELTSVPRGSPKSWRYPFIAGCFIDVSWKIPSFELDDN